MTYAGGGGGGNSSTVTGGSGGSGGGGDVGVAADPNTGGGGGGYNKSVAGAGGSGIVIVRVPDTITATFSAGVTHSLSTVTGYNIYTVTETSTTAETVIFTT